MKKIILTRLTEAIEQDNDTLALTHADALCAWLRADLLQESLTKHYELPSTTEDKE